MVLLPQDERDRLTGEFWEAVRSKLVGHYAQPANEADRGIGQYRHTIYRRGIGDLVYNQGVEKTAAVVDGIIKNGVPEPAAG
jgi:hypothetical protein